MGGRGERGREKRGRMVQWAVGLSDLLKFVHGVYLGYEHIGNKKPRVRQYNIYC